MVVFPFIKLKDGDSYLVGKRNNILKRFTMIKRLGLYCQSNELNQLNNSLLVQKFLK